MSDSKLQSLGSLVSKAKQIVVNVAKYFLQESKKETSPASYIRRTEEATGVSRTIVLKIRKEQMDTGEHEDSFIINLADDSSTDESCDDYDSSTETASEGEWNDVFFSLLCKLFSVYYWMK